MIYEKDVHTEHCCAKHGCKYGHPDCPVENGTKPQSYPCEYCGLDQERMEAISDEDLIAELSRRSLPYADALTNAAENVVIAHGMGWDMDGVIDVLRAETDRFKAHPNQIPNINERGRE